jgi:CheY-like chemotaxis protein
MKEIVKTFQKASAAPRQEEPPTAAKVYELTEEPVAARPKLVLLLEDDVEFGEMLSVFLESHSFSVVRVTNGADGLRQIMANNFDIILCDMVMPNLPGDMFYLAVQRTKPHLCKRFIFMTGHQADPKWDGFIRKVCGIMLWKPFQLADLLTTIQNTLNKSP